MELITTKSFVLAIYSKGDINSERLALVLPGKLDTKDYAHMRSHVDFLASKGFFSLSFDPPGTWESQGDMGLYNMTNYLKSVDEIIEYFGDRKTFVIGHSMGASVAILAGLMNPQITSFASIFPGIDVEYASRDNEDELEERGCILHKRDLPPGGGQKIKEFKLPYSFLEDRFKYNAGGLKNSTKPKLFVLGKHDDLVTPDEVKKLYNTASEPKELYELDSDHDYRLHVDLINEVNLVVGNFLQRFGLL